MWAVLRWFAVFVAAILVIVAALYQVLGRPLPFPHLF